MKAKSTVTLAALALLLAIAPSANTQTLNVLHTFEGTDGAGPAALAIDAAGNLYGSTSGGGIQNCSSPGRFCGTLFELAKQNSNFAFHTLYQFQNNQDGFSPNSPLTIGPGGILYGSTLDGGIEGGWGTVFSLRPTCSDLGCRQMLWKKTILWAFGQCDGAGTNGGLVMDAAGNLYGTTIEMCGHGGQVYELSPAQGLNGSWQKTPVHTFQGPPDGRWPEGPVVFDTTGNLYGSTLGGGSSDLGTVYELTLQARTWSEAVLHNFSGPDGIKPIGNLVRDGSGNFYGVTNGDSQPGGAFELTPVPGGWNITRLYAFQPGQAQNVASGLVMDGAGNLYGVAGSGGANGYGTIYKLTPNGNRWSYSTVYDFTGGSNGSNPQGPLVLDAGGNLYGSAATGGDLNCNAGLGCGTLWQISLP